VSNYKELEDIINAELVKQAEDILAHHAESIDYDNELVDMVERLTAIWYSGYEFGLDNYPEILLDEYEGRDYDNANA
jgi:hypothetical protein